MTTPARRPNQHDQLAERFETDRPRLRTVAYRMLGSLAEADDAVQETWIRLSRTDTDTIKNMSAWLTTVVARVSLNMLQSRKARREDLVAETGAAARSRGDASRPSEAPADPEQEALLADSVGLALLVVLDTLSPAERLAFVLHDMFAVPFEEIAAIVDRSPAATRQLASRARRRVQQVGSEPDIDGPGPKAVPEEAAFAPAGQAGKADLVRAFLAASREGEFEALLAILDPNVLIRADQAATRLGVESDIRGADAVSRVFAGRTWSPVPALIEGTAGLVWAYEGEPHVAFRFSIDEGLITAIDIQADLDGLAITMC